MKHREISGSKAFQSQDNFQQLLNRLKSSIKSSPNGEVIVLKLVEAETHRAKNIIIKINIKDENNPRKEIEDIKDKIEEFVECPLREKYRVIIDNIQTKQIDKRAFSMRFNGTIAQCMDSMKLLLEKIVAEETDDGIVFTHEKFRNYTHRVFIQKCGTASDYEKVISKSFSIKLTNYSSEEIVGLIRGKLQNGKK